jgi:hypothetical protein
MGGFALLPLHAADNTNTIIATNAAIEPNGPPLEFNLPYDKNTTRAPKEQVITEIGKTVRLTPAPISAMHPFMKSLRLDNGDLLFGCPLSEGSFRDYALSPKEDGGFCSLRSTDKGNTWHKTRSDTSRDGGKSWTSEPTSVRKAARLDDGTFVSDYDQGLVCVLSPTADKQLTRLLLRSPISQISRPW